VRVDFASVLITVSLLINRYLHLRVSNIGYVLCL
jgi:hypothetical protein